MGAAPFERATISTNANSPAQLLQQAVCHGPILRLERPLRIATALLATRRSAMVSGSEVL